MNLCRDLSHFRCFDSAADKLDEMWTGRPVYIYEVPEMQIV